MLILKGVKIICFDTLSQVLILKELERNIIHAQKLAHLPVAHCTGAFAMAMLFSLVWSQSLKKKKRGRAPAGKAQISTRFMIAERVATGQGRIALGCPLPRY